MGKIFEKRNMPSGSPDESQLHVADKDTLLPNSLAANIMQQPEAEAEADLLSEGVTSTSPATLRREMGERLGADFPGYSSILTLTAFSAVRRSAHRHGRRGTMSILAKAVFHRRLPRMNWCIPFSRARCGEMPPSPFLTARSR